jgi:SAM-dependent methyltransferase
MTQYQSFPGVKGASESLAKLEALRLPPLQGKRFLDVGCNEGFFCGYARFDGAAEVIGIDASKATIARAQARFPDCRFLARSWDQLPEGRFDVILLASALHYADDQAALIHRLIASLTDEGTLVLEIGLASSGKSEWVRVKRSIDERLFPSRGKLAEILDDYAWKIIGDSVQQAGDPLRRYVVHVRRQKPFAFLLLEPPASRQDDARPDAFCPGEGAGGVRRSDLSADVDGPGRRFGSPGVLHQHRFFASVQSRRGARAGAGPGRRSGRGLVPAGWRRGVCTRLLRSGKIPAAGQGRFSRPRLHPVMLTWEMEKSMSGPGEAASRAAVYVDALAERVVESDAPCLQVTKLHSPALAAILSGWHLDAPVNGQVVIMDEPLTVAGWGLTNDLGVTDLQCYTRSGGVMQVFKLDRPRQDVLTARLQAQVDLHEKLLHCGFRCARPIDELAAGIEFGFLADGEEIPGCALRACRPRSGQTLP